MGRYDVVVIGGGISGTSFAHYAAKAGLSTLIIEKEAQVGGCFFSHQFKPTGEKQANDFWLELGAHTCYNTYGCFLDLLQDLGLQGSIISRKKVPFRILADNKIASIASGIHYLDLVINFPRMVWTRKAGLSVKEYYSRILGRRNYDDLFYALLNAVPSQDTSQFPADVLFKKRRRSSGVPKSFTLAGGLQHAPLTIASSPLIDIVTKTSVTSLRDSGNGFEVTCDNGNTFSCTFATIAAAPSTAASILGPMLPQLSGTLEKIRVSSVESMGVVVRNESLKMEPMAGLIPLDGPFFSMVSRDTVDHHIFRGFSFHFKPRRLDSNEKKRLITEILGIQEKHIDDFVERSCVIPSPMAGHQNLIKEIEKMLTHVPRLFLTGNYFQGLSIEDCVSRSKEESQRLLSLRKGI